MHKSTGTTNKQLLHLPSDAPFVVRTQAAVYLPTTVKRMGPLDRFREIISGGEDRFTLVSRVGHARLVLLRVGLFFWDAMYGAHLSS